MSCMLCTQVGTADLLDLLQPTATGDPATMNSDTMNHPEKTEKAEKAETDRPTSAFLETVYQIVGIPQGYSETSSQVAPWKYSTYYSRIRSPIRLPEAMMATELNPWTKKTIVCKYSNGRVVHLRCPGSLQFPGSICLFTNKYIKGLAPLDEEKWDEEMPSGTFLLYGVD